MQFSVGRPDMIRAINQRWLLKFWKRELGNQRVPRWQTVEAEDLRRVTTHLSFLDVVGDGDDARFQIRFHGTMVGRVYGSDDCRGKYINDMMPPGAGPNALMPYYKTVVDGCPVYTVHDVIDRQGRVVHFERLLLPFSRDGQIADRILASFEFVSPDGAFESQALMTTLTAPPALRLSATIPSFHLAG